jgi:hypothetical protein
MIMQEPQGPYLCPKQLSQSKGAHAVTSQAEQTDEHDYQQDDVANKHKDESFHITSHARVAAGAVWMPNRVDLQLDEHKIY